MKRVPEDPSLHLVGTKGNRQHDTTHGTQPAGAQMSALESRLQNRREQTPAITEAISRDQFVHGFVQHNSPVPHQQPHTRRADVNRTIQFCP